MKLDSPQEAGLLCVYCGGPATAWDHVVPIAKGGLAIPSNLVPTCQPCNTAKKDRLLPTQKENI